MCRRQRRRNRPRLSRKPLKSWTATVTEKPAPAGPSPVKAAGHEPWLLGPRLRRDKVPGHLRHHLAKFIRLITRAAQNRRHHLVRQKIVERRPGAIAPGAPELRRPGEPYGVKFDIGFGTILDRLIPLSNISSRPGRSRFLERTCAGHEPRTMRLFGRRGRHRSSELWTRDNGNFARYSASLTEPFRVSIVPSHKAFGTAIF